MNLRLIATRLLAGVTAALMLAGAALAQGGNVSNVVAVWGVNSSGQPCIVAPVGATGAVTCWLPNGSGGGGGGGAVFGPTAVGSAVANPPIMTGFQTAGGNVAIVTPSVGLPVNIVAGGGTSANVGAINATAPTSAGYTGLINGSGLLVGMIQNADLGAEVHVMNPGGVVTGNQSNAGPGTTGSANLGTNSYNYGWNVAGSGWLQMNVAADGSSLVSQDGSWAFSSPDGGIVSLGSKGDLAWSGTGAATLISIAKAQYAATILPLAAQSSAGVDIGATEEKYWGGTLLGAASSYGTSPGAVEVPGVNAFLTGFATGTAGTPGGGVATVQGAASMTPLLVTPSAPADPCFASLKLQADFESTSSGGSIIAAASGKKAYVCSVSIAASAAANVSLIEGTGSSVCTGGTTAGDFLNTGVTAANGAAFAANGGNAFGSGNGTLFFNNTANQNTCVLFTTGGTPQVNVHVTYVQQ